MQPARAGIDAAERYEDAAAGWLRYGSAFERAQAWFGLGRTLEALDRPGADEAFDRARAGFEALGAAPWLARIDEIGHERAAAT